MVKGAEGGGGDNPVFVQNMIEFFRANSADLAYEIYFNQTVGTTLHKVYPNTDNPLASAKYKATLQA